MSRSPVRIRSVAPKRNPRKLACEADFRGVFVCAAGDGKVGACALITPVYLEIALLSGARSGAQATGQVISAIDIADISIRTLREEGDSARICCSRFRINFYPRPPRGGRRMLPAFFLGMYEFLSAPSARRATSTRWLIRDPTTNFYPRPPRGGRHTSRRHRQHRANFYPRPPRGGRP